MRKEIAMTRELFASLCFELLGDNWKRKLAKKFQVTDRTAERWNGYAVAR